MNPTLPMRTRNLADREGLARSRRHHELMIELLKGRDSWALAQLCVDHMQFSNRIIWRGLGRRRLNACTRTHTCETPASSVKRP